jgi:hypothetical protein
MTLHACNRKAESRDRCRYDDRLTDSACSGCALRKPDPPRARGPGWLDRQRQAMELLKHDLGHYRNPDPDKTRNRQ